MNAKQEMVTCYSIQWTWDSKCSVVSVEGRLTGKRVQLENRPAAFGYRTYIDADALNTTREGAIEAEIARLEAIRSRAMKEAARCEKQIALVRELKEADGCAAPKERT